MGSHQEQDNSPGLDLTGSPEVKEQKHNLNQIPQTDGCALPQDRNYQQKVCGCVGEQHK